MQYGAITSYFDVAQITLYGFWIFFAGLIMYLRREDKREGYPMISDRSDERWEGVPPMPPSKTYLLPHGQTVTTPRIEDRQAFNAEPTGDWPGAPRTPIGNPMLAAVGPGSYANRADVPDHTFDDELPKIVPLRAAADFFLAWEDPDPRGMELVGLDGVVAGTIVDAWVDRSEVVIRYLEAELGEGGRHVLVPMNFLHIDAKRRRIVVGALRGEHFADVPALRNPDVVTLLEEDKILGYYGGGLMYATPDRVEPLL